MTEIIHRYRTYQGRRAWLILLAAFYSVVLLQARSPGTKSCDLMFHDTLREASLVSIPAQARILPADFARLSALNVAAAQEWVAARCPVLDQLTRGGPEAKSSASPNHFIDGLEAKHRSALIVEGMSQLIGKAGPALKTVFKRKPKNFPNPGDAALEFVDALRGARPNDVVNRVRAWGEAFNKGLSKVIRSRPAFLEMLSKFPFGTSMKKIGNEATDVDFRQIFSGNLKSIPDPDPALSQRLRNKFGPNTKTNKKFDTDPAAKEFDAITDSHLVKHKSLTSTNPMSTTKRAQMKYQMRSCKALDKVTI